MTKKKTNSSKGKGWKDFISFFKNKNNQKVFGFLFLLFALYFFISFASFFFTWEEDFSVIKNNSWISVLTNSNIQTENSLGKFGALFSFLFVYSGFGISAFFIPGFLLFSGLHLLGYNIISLKKYIRESIWGLIWIPVFICHFFKSQSFSGNIGFNFTELLYSQVEWIGTTLLIIFTFLIFITLRFNITPQKIINFINKLKPEKNIDKFKKVNNPTLTPLPTSDSEENLKVKEAVLPKETEKVEEKIENDDVNMNIVELTEEEELDNSEIQEKLKELGEYDPTLELSSYKFPNIDLLNDYGSGEININKEELEANKQRIVDTLGNYNIGITSVSATIGPTITLYEIVPEAGIRIAKIKNLEDDIALSLAAEGIRIIAPIPGKGTVGIEVPNQNPTTVSMSTVLKSDKFQNSNMDLPIAFGKTISNETFVADLAKMPHLLMAGATGQGKSVGLNVILASLLYKKHPSQIKFVLVDPKKVELTLFNKIERHFLAKLPDTEEAIITDTKKVVNTVNSLCIEMDQRYDLLKNAMCRNLKEYNTKFVARKLNPNEGHRYLPYIILVIDEFADLIMTAGKEIETPISRLAQLARAIGIHLIVATQRPSVNVITGIIKANFPARAAFRVTSRIDSRTILDAGGADQLIGKGDMLISTGSDLTRLQCAFIDTPEVEKICDFIGSQRAYPEAYLLPEYVGDTEGTGNDADLDNRDALFDNAARLVVSQQTGSTSNIQRRMKIGYNRAGRIIDELEAAGVVGPFEGSKARQVLIKNEMELDELLNNLNNNE
ncbi:MAG: DNA translocase FtsK [Flavobacteriales bacterium]|nr:DNA translocase FtsK [Flavobacteriales bacterium]|tara:strand:- start:2902 stop:5244 length:2343 start_codon:yes stop_codon:yes gene_type:complete